MWNFALPAELKNVFLTTQEAAEFLKIGKSTLEQARLTGSGPPYVRFGPKAIRYRVSDLEGWGVMHSATCEYRH